MGFVAEPWSPLSTPFRVTVGRFAATITRSVIAAAVSHSLEMILINSLFVVVADIVDIHNIGLCRDSLASLWTVSQVGGGDVKRVHE